MKTIVKISISVATMLFAIVFFNGCTKDDDEKDDPIDEIESLVSGSFDGKVTANVENAAGIPVNLAVAVNAPGFNSDGDLDGNFFESTIVLFSGGSFSITLPTTGLTPYLEKVTDFFDSFMAAGDKGKIKVSNPSAKIMDVDFIALYYDEDEDELYAPGMFYFRTSDKKTTCLFVYVDSDVNVTGSANVTVSLKQGWNRVYLSTKITTKSPDGMKWYYESFGNTPIDEPGTEALFASFTFDGIEGTATINAGTPPTIVAKASATTDLTTIKPSFTVSKGAKVTVNGVTQVSGTTMNDFTNPVTYTVVSEDGKTTNSWTVTITKDNDGGGKVWVDKKDGATVTLANLDAALLHIMMNGLGDYTVRIGENQHITSNYNFFMQKDLNVTLKAESGTVEITREVDLPKHFIVMMEASLTLDKGITLKGFGAGESIENEDGGIEVVEKGKLIMNEGSKLTNFGNKIDGSGAVLVLREGVFEMNGGTICDNFSYGVHVGAPDGLDGGTFTMNGGTISDNGTPTYGLSGVFIDNGTFNMNDGTISGNVCGGVRVDEGQFSMKNGRIINNIEEKGGGGVCVWDDGIFIMDGGEISGNQTISEYDGGDGGGVLVAGSFVMNGGTIANNTSSNIGGGVFVYTDGIFTMNGGTIAGNTTLTKAGAGVGLYKDATFTKTGNSIIYGLNGGANANIAISGVGYAAYVGAAPPTEAKRDETAGEGVELRWVPSGAKDGWDD